MESDQHREPWNKGKLSLEPAGSLYTAHDSCELLKNSKKAGCVPATLEMSSLVLKIFHMTAFLLHSGISQYYVTASQDRSKQCC